MKLPFFKSEQELVEEIHREVDTAQDRLLEQAKRIIATASEERLTPEERQAERLKRIGFVNTPVVKKAEAITKKKQESKTIVVESEEQAKLVQYYQSTYPFLKFLTEKELDRICGKYNLIYAPIANYIGEVPDKNISDIENVQPLKEKDSIVRMYEFFDLPTRYEDETKQFLDALGKKEPMFTKKEIDDLLIKHYGHVPSDWTDFEKGEYNDTCWWVLTGKIIGKSCSLWRRMRSCSKQGLFIAAPQKDFDLKGLDKKDKGFFSVFTVNAKDPIVFRYVRGGIQVCSKWGLEANDPSLVLPINN